MSANSIDLKLQMSDGHRRTVQRCVNHLAEQGIQWSFDAHAVQPGYIFCTARYTLATGPQPTHEQMQQACAELVRTLHQVGYTVLLSTWTAEEPAPAHIVVQQGRRTGRQNDVLQSTYRIISYWHNKTQRFGVLRQRAPRILFEERGDQLVQIVHEERLYNVAWRNAQDEAELWWRNMLYMRRRGAPS